MRDDQHDRPSAITTIVIASIFLFGAIVDFNEYALPLLRMLHGR